jgi:uncharacterized protein (UPF0332 family)
MTGRDFVVCAGAFAKGASEAELRSAVSRAYYGAFHEARVLLADTGVRLPKTEQVHLKVGYCLQDCGEENAAKAGQQLEILRTQRKAADYDLDDQRFADRHTAEVEVARAQRILRALEACRAGSGAVEFGERVRAHARILGLTVRE